MITLKTFQFQQEFPQKKNNALSLYLCIIQIKDPKFLLFPKNCMRSEN